MTLIAYIRRLTGLWPSKRGWLRGIIPVLLLLPSFAWAQTILILGDSISAAYGVKPKTAWVARLQARLPDDRVINASISGEMTSGGRVRLPRLLTRYRPDVVVIELGGNDGLRGFPIAQIRDNLSEMVRLSREGEARVLLLGMRIPPNYGTRYTGAFHRVYADVASRFRIPLVPFLLDGIATHDDLMQADGLHPNDRAQRALLENVWEDLRVLLELPSEPP